jgi:hypothetical protein
MPNPDGTFTIREREAAINAMKILNQILTAKEIRSGAPRHAYMIAMGDMQLVIQQMHQALLQEMTEAGVKPDTDSYNANSVPKITAAKPETEVKKRTDQVLSWSQDEVDEEIKRIAARFHLTAGGPDDEAQGPGQEEGPLFSG